MLGANTLFEIFMETLPGIPKRLVVFLQPADQ